MQCSTNLKQLTQQERWEVTNYLFNEMSDAFVIFNENGKIIEANNAACQLYQWCHEELVGLHGYDVIFKGNNELFDEFIKKISQKKIFEKEGKFFKKNGKVFSAKIKGFSFAFHNNKLFLAIIKEIPYINSTSSLKKYQHLLQNIPDVVWTIDQHGKTRFITENVLDLLGFSATEIYGQDEVWFNRVHPDDLEKVKQAYTKLFNKHLPFDIEYRVQTKKGEWIWVNNRSTNVYTLNKKVVADGILYDISKRKHIEMKLKQSEKRFKSLFENAPDPYYLHDLKGHFLDGNKKAEHMLGYKKEELIGKNLVDLEILPKKYIHKALKIMGAAKKGKSTGPDEFKLRKKDGSEIITEINTIPVNINGKRLIMGVAHDITARKKTENRLREAKESFETLFNTMADPVMILDKKGKFIELTDKVKDYTGFEKNEILGQNFLKTKLLTPKSKAICIKNLFKRMAGVDVKPYEVEALTKEGKKIPFEVNAERITYKGNPADLVVFRDISNRKKAETKLRQSEKTYRNLFQNAQVGLFRTRLENGQIIECNNQLAQMFGFKKRKEFIDKYQLEKFYVNPDDRKDLINQLQKDGYVNHFETAFYRKDKSIFWARYSAKLDSEHGWIEGVFEDITALKKAEDRLKHKHEQLKSEQKQLLSIFDSINHAVYVADPETYEILFMNSKLKKSLKQNANGKKCYQVLQNKNSPCDFCTNDIILKNKGNPYKWEYHNPRTGKDYELTDKIIKWPDGRNVRLELAVDITERKKALDEIKKAHQTVSAFNTELEAKVQEKTARIEQLLKQKDEFINQLGHDLKNPLGPLINLLPLVEKNTTDEKYKKMLNVAIRNIGYMKNLVVKTIELAKLNSPNTRFNFEKIQLADLVDNIIESHKFSSEEKQINIKNAIAKDLVISADRLRMEELFNNLINNAVKYSEQNGQISIHAFIKNEHVRISITDNGIGMTKEQIAHLFDEFYKADESRHDFESSGLGMPICKRIVDKHNGKIWAESKGIGQGSTMYIKLPLHQNKNKDIEQKKDAFEREENSKKQQSDHDSVAQEIDQLIEQKT